MIAFLLLAVAQPQSDVRQANGPFVRGEWRGDCVRGGDSKLAETCRARRAGPVALSILRTDARLEITARPRGCTRLLKPTIIKAEDLEGMRRAAVVSEAVDAAARGAIKLCRSKAKPPELDGSALFDMLAATDGLIMSDE